MTGAEAREAARMVEALADLQAINRIFDTKKFSDTTEVGVGLSHDFSDSGHDNIGGVAIVDPKMAAEVMAFLETRIRARLADLGVEP